MMATISGCLFAGTFGLLQRQVSLGENFCTADVVGRPSCKNFLRPAHSQPSWLPILHSAKRLLQDADIVSYAYDAEILLCHVLNIRRVDLYTSDFTIMKSQKSQFENLVEKRAKRVPLQYITGRTEFFGLPFFVEPGVFIPRPETEILVETVLNVLKRDDGGSVLDLCTGSGCIAISLAKYAECDKIIATDISQKALEIARKNAFINAADGRIEFKKADLFQGLSEKFDIIVCNPPYIRRIDLESLPPEISYEPVVALDGGEDGLDFYRRIFEQVPEFLKENGILAMELGDSQADAIKEIFSGKMEFIKDLNATERVLIWIK